MKLLASLVSPGLLSLSLPYEHTAGEIGSSISDTT